MYIENPKTKGSGILTCIPQIGLCPMKCNDCFFQSGRSYLEPLDDNLPNMPELSDFRVFRINDGNDSNNKQREVIEVCDRYKMKFYNTSIPKYLDEFDAPVVLTINPAKKTNTYMELVHPIPKNLMFIRIRTNMWNLPLVDIAVNYYTSEDIAVILTFMAYYDNLSVPEQYINSYMFRKRTLNSYYAITTDAWRKVMQRYEDNIRVYSCGKLEGEKGKTSCKYCGNCLREYFATITRMNVK